MPFCILYFQSRVWSDTNVAEFAQAFSLFNILIHFPMDYSHSDPSEHEFNKVFVAESTVKSLGSCSKYLYSASKPCDCGHVSYSKLIFQLHLNWKWVGFLLKPKSDFWKIFWTKSQETYTDDEFHKWRKSSLVCWGVSNPFLVAYMSWYPMKMLCSAFTGFLLQSNLQPIPLWTYFRIASRKLNTNDIVLAVSL